MSTNSGNAIARALAAAGKLESETDCTPNLETWAARALISPDELAAEIERLGRSPLETQIAGYMAPTPLEIATTTAGLYRALNRVVEKQEPQGAALKLVTEVLGIKPVDKPPAALDLDEEGARALLKRLPVKVLEAALEVARAEEAARHE